MTTLTDIVCKDAKIVSKIVCKFGEGFSRSLFGPMTISGNISLFKNLCSSSEDVDLSRHTGRIVGAVGGYYALGYAVSKGYGKETLAVLAVTNTLDYLYNAYKRSKDATKSEIATTNELGA